MNKISVYRGWCKKCGICIAFCPHKVLKADKALYPVVKHLEKCNGCRLCEIRCPDFAMVVYKNGESYAETSSPSGQ